VNHVVESNLKSFVFLKSNDGGGYVPQLSPALHGDALPAGDEVARVQFLEDMIRVGITFT